MNNNSWYKKERPLLGLFGSGGGLAQGGEIAAPQIEATGGSINEYTDPTGQIWKSHTFQHPGTFTVSKVGSAMSGGVEYLVVGGGGGGGSASPADVGGSGGGAGGFRTNVSGHPPRIKALYMICYQCISH